MAQLFAYLRSKREQLQTHLSFGVAVSMRWSDSLEERVRGGHWLRPTLMKLHNRVKKACIYYQRIIRSCKLGNRQRRADTPGLITNNAGRHTDEETGRSHVRKRDNLRLDAPVFAPRTSAELTELG
jgi:hypothetical protein